MLVYDVLDAIDARGLWADTAVIVCTDHGHYLGEKEIWGKPAVPAYEPLGHIPLMIAWPGITSGAKAYGYGGLVRGGEAGSDL